MSDYQPSFLAPHLHGRQRWQWGDEKNLEWHHRMCYAYTPFWRGGTSPGGVGIVIPAAQCEKASKPESEGRVKHWTARACYAGITLGCMVVLTGCAFQRIHYKSLVQMQAETATNYSQQVLAAIIGVCDNARLPVLFSVESGASTWTPIYNSNATATIPTLIVGQTSVIGTLGGGESLTTQLQYNDFGSAAMSRAVSLYRLLCFTIQYGTTVLPNGTLRTVVEQADSHEHFLIWGKRRNGQYLGVTREKNEQFLHFAHDITYWTRHATPDVHDLTSTTGKLFRFSAEYPTVVANLVSSRLAWFQTSEALTSIQEAFKTKQQAFEALKKEVRTSKAPGLVLQTLLQTDIQELTALGQAVAKLAGDHTKLDGDILNNSNQLVALEMLLADIFRTLKRHDPDLAGLDIEAIMAAYRKSGEVLLNGDRQQLEAAIVLKPPQVSGAKAQESIDKLYRERFESLPQSFSDPRRQSTP